MNYHRLPDHEAKRAFKPWALLKSALWWTGCVITALAFGAYVSNATAETYLHTGAYSHHVGSDYDYNETHYLAAVEHESVMVGYFRNSFGDDSAMAGYWFKDQWGEHVEASVLMGATYGYRGDCLRPSETGGKEVCALAVPSITYTEYLVQPSVFVMGNAVAVSVRWELY